MYMYDITYIVLNTLNRQCNNHYSSVPKVSKSTIKPSTHLIRFLSLFFFLCIHMRMMNEHTCNNSLKLNAVCNKSKTKFNTNKEQRYTNNSNKKQHQQPHPQNKILCTPNSWWLISIILIRSLRHDERYHHLIWLILILEKKIYIFRLKKNDSISGGINKWLLAVYVRTVHKQWRRVIEMFVVCRPPASYKADFLQLQLKSNCTQTWVLKFTKHIFNSPELMQPFGRRQIESTAQ